MDGDPHRQEATKGIRWMPGCLLPRKDVVHCEKFRSGVCSRDEPEMSEWGNPPEGMFGRPALNP